MTYHSDRELMQMALDALEEAWNYGYTDTSVSNALSERLNRPDWAGLTDEEFTHYAHWMYPEKLSELENLLKEKNG